MVINDPVASLNVSENIISLSFIVTIAITVCFQIIKLYSFYSIALAKPTWYFSTWNIKFYSKPSNSIIFDTNNDQKFGSTSCDIWGTRTGFFSWNTLVWPKQPLQVQSLTPRYPLIFLGPVLINLIWFIYQNFWRMGFVLSHMQRLLDYFIKTGFLFRLETF